MAKRKRERAGLPRRYSFKLHPAAEQREALNEQCVMMTRLWNAMLEMQEARYRRTRGQKGVVHAEGKSMLTFYDLTSEITQMRHECPEWAELSVWSAHRVADALTGSFQAFFRRAKQGAGAQSGYPRYRSVRRANWVPHRFQSGCKLWRRDHRPLHHRLRLKGVPGEIHCMGKLPDEPLDWNYADIRCHSGVWWLSVGVEMPRRRAPGDEHIEVRFDLIDSFASINGEAVPMRVINPSVNDESISRIVDLQRQMAEAKRGSAEYRDLRLEKARLEARAARRRREALHEWTTAIVRRAASLTVVRPPVKEVTRTGRGHERDWGANVKLKAEFNRTVLDQAPSLAADMLTYKAAEVGIPYREAVATHLVIGNLAVRNRKQLRRTRRTVRQELENVAI